MLNFVCSLEKSISKLRTHVSKQKQAKTYFAIITPLSLILHHLCLIIWWVNIRKENAFWWFCNSIVLNFLIFLFTYPVHDWTWEAVLGHLTIMWKQNHEMYVQYVYAMPIVYYWITWHINIFWKLKFCHKIQCTFHIFVYTWSSNYPTLHCWCNHVLDK